MTSAKALQALKNGNARFVAGCPLSRDHAARVRPLASGQRPFAAVVGCVDSRVPPEIVFDCGLGDLICVRVAGNVVNADVLGSLEFACRVLGTKLIVVLGHSHCGAVQAACDAAAFGNLTQLLAKMRPAIEAAQAGGEARDAAFAQRVADANVALSVERIRKESALLETMFARGEIDLVGAMYDLESGEVLFHRA